MKQTLRLRGELCPKTKLYTKILYTIFITFTIVLVSCVCTRAQVSASSQEVGPAAEAVSEIKPLKIGDTIPDALWNMPLQMVKAGQEGAYTVTLNDYKGKLIILDFWAIWCGSCIAAFPKTHKLQKEFSKEIYLLPIGSDAQEKVRAFMQKNEKGKALGKSVVEDTLLKIYFPHVYIPHYVWIYKGKVQAFTNVKELSSTHITAVLNQHGNNIRYKEDILNFDKYMPFAKNWEKVFVKPLVAATMLTKHVNGVSRTGARQYTQDSSIYRQNFINTPLIDIYNLAAGVPYNFFINEAQEKKIFENIDNDPYWSLDNSYCFEIIAPTTIPLKRRASIIINDLNTKLGLNGRFEKRMIDCYVLVENDKVQDPHALRLDSTRIVGEIRLPANDIVKSFNYHFEYIGRRPHYNPILINESSAGKKYFMPIPQYRTSIELFNTAMKPQGLMAIPARREIEVFVLSEIQ